MAAPHCKRYAQAHGREIHKDEAPARGGIFSGNSGDPPNLAHRPGRARDFTDAGVGPFMRAGILLSVAGHAALLLWVLVLLGHPTPFHTVPPDAITVDIVPASEVALNESPPALEQFGAAAPAAREPRAGDKPDATGSARPRQSPPAQAGPRQQPTTARPQATPQQRVGPRPQPADQQPPVPPSLLVYDATVAPVPGLPLPSGGTENAFGGFDAPADSTAALPIDVIAELKVHVQRCWNPPAPLASAQKLKVVLRVSLEPGGALAGQPMLLEASASPHGPALVETAVRALKDCQPYGFLPAQKYQEWKVLDLRFTPQGIAGG